MRDLKARVESLRQFFGLIDGLASRLLSLDEAEMADLGHLFAESPEHKGRDEEVGKLIADPLFSMRHPGLKRCCRHRPVGCPPITRKRPARLSAHLWAEGVDNSPWGWGLSRT